ncbi:MAG: hypothetical protein ACOC7R_03975 [Planctomycetota bacterium]
MARAEPAQRYRNIQRDGRSPMAEVRVPALGPWGVELWLKATPLYDSHGRLIGGIEIAAASNEQAQGIEQVTTAVTQMDQVTQSSAANAEESASAAAELNAQANDLKAMVQALEALVGGATGATAAGAAAKADPAPSAAPKTSTKAATTVQPVQRRTTPTGEAAPSESEPAETIPMDEKELVAF